MLGEIDAFLIAVFVAVVVACALMMGVAWWLLGRRIRLLRVEIEREMDRATSEATTRIGDEVEARVRRGVRDGIRDGVTSLPSREVLEGTTRAAAKAGADLIGEGLGTLLGGRRDRRRR